MKVKQFTDSVLSTHKMFFLLKNLPKNSTDVDIKIHTPNGDESVDFIDVFKMKDGSLLAAWTHPLQKLGLQNLVASAGGETQILNLYPFERILEIYNKPVDSDFGVFTFANSKEVANADWRCDRGYYGAARFEQDFSEPIVANLDDIIMYESFFSIAGAGHLIYLEVAKNKEFADAKLNNSIQPTVGRTLQELLRLVYEWSVIAGPPFNGTNEVALAAKKFVDSLKLTDVEIAQIENLTPMQISQFLSGSTEARVRPNNISPMTSGVLDIILDRMACSSLSFIVYRNPEIWDIQSILKREFEELEAGIARFKTYYGIPLDINMDNWDIVEEIAAIWVPKQGAYVHNQLRHFTNKKALLGVVQRNERLISDE